MDVSRENLKKEVEKVAAPFKGQMQLDGKEMTIVQDASVPPGLNFDTKLYQECLFNLMQNANKFTLCGDKIKITQAYNKETKLLSTKVHDSGRGIEEERQKTLFTVFRQHFKEKRMVGEYGRTSGIGIGL